MNKAAKSLISAGAVLLALQAQSPAQKIDVGQTEYLSNCGSCHGNDAKGKGPVADQLKVTPTNLTQLAKKNGGVFPVSAVYEIIDGRKAVAAHGSREMPVWGAYQLKYLYPYPAEKFIDRTYDPEALERTRILTIIDYLNRIQEK
jgi:mono/diheme cytochrome c family protein